MEKHDEFNKLIQEMANCGKCLNLKKKSGVDCSLINIYKDKAFCKNIPSIWTDWFNRLDAKIMIVGQDWGPFKDMRKFHDEYIKNKTLENWNSLIEEEKSMTKRLLTKYLKESALICGVSADNISLDDMFITNAIMCARNGDNYRGDNIKLKESTIFCSNFLEKQVEIVRPKVILTLGYYPLLAISKIFGFEIEKNLKSTIEKIPYIKISDYIIIPLYHPVSQVKRKIQLSQYKRIWENI